MDKTFETGRSRQTEMEDASKPARHILHAARREADHILIGITDDDPAMSPPGTREKLFTLFFSYKGHKGAGAGLFITHKVIHQHGCEIHVNSPLAPAPASTSAFPPPSRTPPRPRRLRTNRPWRLILLSYNIQTYRLSERFAAKSK